MTGLRNALSEVLTGKPTSQPPPPPAGPPPPMQYPMRPPPPPMHHHAPPPPHHQQPLPQIPWLLISSTDIRSSASPMPLFSITRSRASGHFSRDSLLTITRLATGAPIGTISFESSGNALASDEYVELTTANDGGRATHKMKEDGTFHFRWTYRPCVAPGAKWYWSEAGEGGAGLKMTEGGKDGRLLATLRGGTLVCESGVGFTEAAVDEVVVTAVAMLEKRKELGEQAETAQGVSEVVMALSGGGGA